ncbi:MAG: methionyl-tRNA formyltransferase [Mogibacterium sp.]|nr:methionyl-tRNA formyltransferase [Mogibacterium sp.]
MRVIFMGTPEFAVPSLQALIDAGYEIPLVVTQPDRKGNRGKVEYSPVKKLAMAHHIDVIQPVSIRREPEQMQLLESLAPDLIVVAAFGQILPQRVLDIPAYGCINVHGSLLPALRGAAPIQYAILQGLEETGVTIMRMEQGLDTGDMIAKASLPAAGLTTEELSGRMADLGASLLIRTIPAIVDGTAVYEKQEDAQSSYAPVIRKTDGLTDLHEPAEILKRKCLAFDPWPSLYSYLDGKQFKFYGVRVTGAKPDGPAGTVSSVGKNSFTVNCSDGQLEVLELQVQGKKRMRAGDFLRGSRMEPGARFTAEQ